MSAATLFQRFMRWAVSAPQPDTTASPPVAATIPPAPVVAVDQVVATTGVVVDPVATDNPALTLAMRLIRAFEGCRLRAYQDIVGVWTICFGSTKGVVAGQERTQTQCDLLLTAAQQSYDAAIDSYKHGLATFVDVTTAQTALTRARTADADATSLLYTATAALAFSTGDLAPPIPESTPGASGRPR